MRVGKLSLSKWLSVHRGEAVNSLASLLTFTGNRHTYSRNVSFSVMFCGVLFDTNLISRQVKTNASIHLQMTFGSDNCCCSIQLFRTLSSSSLSMTHHFPFWFSLPLVLPTALITGLSACLAFITASSSFFLLLLLLTKLLELLTGTALTERHHCFPYRAVKDICTLTFMLRGTHIISLLQQHHQLY